MKTMRRALLAFLAITATTLAALPAAAAEWNVDPAHSNVSFKIRHLAISKVEGEFTDFSGTVTGEADKPGTLSADVTIQTASIDTDNTDRDDHLRSPDFFEADTYPTITFRSTGVEMEGDDKGRIMGELSMHGVTKPVTLDFEYLGMVKDPWGKTRMGFSAKGEIDRRDFGLTWNKALETGGVVVGHEVEMEIDVELIKAE